jgi:hypothetical protein
MLPVPHDDEDAVGVVLGDRVGDGLTRRIRLHLDRLRGGRSAVRDRVADSLCPLPRLVLVVGEPLEPRLLDRGRDDGELVVGLDVLGKLVSGDG